MLTKVWNRIQRIGRSTKNILSMLFYKLTDGTSLTVQAAGELIITVLALVLAGILILAAGFTAVLHMVGQEEEITVKAVA